METLNTSQWRSVDSNSDNLDESATETINSSFLSSNTQKDLEDIDSEDGLLSAMNNLQITATEPPKQLDHSNVDTKIDVNEENELPIEKIGHSQENVPTENTETKDSLNLSETKDSLIASKTKDSLIASKTKDSLNSSKTKDSHNSSKTFIKPRTLIKSRLAVPTKIKTTLLPPSELSKSKVMDSSLNVSVSKNKNPKETDKRIIKTLVDTDEGLQLREERINHFSIPIIDSKKKRTEPIGFSFLSRIKKPVTKINNNEVEKKLKTEIQQTNKNISLNNQRKTVIRCQSAPKINENQNAVKSSGPLKRKLTSQSIKRATTTPSLLAVNNTKHEKVNVSVAVVKKVNQENKSPNESKINMPKTQHQFGKLLPPKLHTDQRAKKRHEFDVKLSQKEMEIKEIRLELEKKQREKEKLEELALRKTMEHRAIPVPEFKVPAPIRSKKPLTEPKSPAWKLKAKQAK